MVVLCYLQLDIDFRVHFPDAVNKFLQEFPQWVKGILSTARLSRKSNIIELLREYDAEHHESDPGARDYMFSLLALLHLLPSSNTRHKAKLSSIELENSLITFRGQQISLDLFLSEKKADHNQKQPFLLCIGNKDSPMAFYLILDSKAVGLGDCGVLRAVDALFKAHFVYWVDYGKCLALFMEFIQKVIYEIECTKMSVRVRELVNGINLMKTG